MAILFGKERAWEGTSHVNIAGQEEDRAQGGGGGLWDRDCYWRFALVVFEGQKGDVY